jgi:hypothetical protein
MGLNICGLSLMLLALSRTPEDGLANAHQKI